MKPTIVALIILSFAIGFATHTTVNLATSKPQEEKFPPYSVVYDTREHKYGAVDGSGAVVRYMEVYESAATWSQQLRRWALDDMARTNARPTLVLPKIVYVTNEVTHTNEVFVIHDHSVEPEIHWYNNGSSILITNFAVTNPRLQWITN